MRATRPAFSELSIEQKKKAIARSYAKVYLKRGKIIEQPCVICGNKAEIHHPDYDKPLEIIWLCRNHHLQLHKEIAC